MAGVSPEKHTIQGSEDILKEWNGFGFKFITRSDYPAVLANLHGSFYKDEPITQTLGCPPERKADMDQKMSDIMDLNHGSFYAYPLDKPDKVASVLLIWFHDKGQSLPPFEERSPLTAIVRYVVLKLHGLYDIFEERNVSVYPELFVISTDKDYRGRGLATQMYRKAIAQLRSQGYPFVSSTFTNPLSRKIGEKLGFKTVAKLTFDECKHPDGSSVFGDAGKPHFGVETILDFQ